jgi:hypothetical protein
MGTKVKLLAAGVLTTGSLAAGFACGVLWAKREPPEIFHIAQAHDTRSSPKEQAYWKACDNCYEKIIVARAKMNNLLPETQVKAAFADVDIAYGLIPDFESEAAGKLHRAKMIIAESYQYLLAIMVVEGRQSPAIPFDSKPWENAAAQTDAALDAYRKLKATASRPVP